MRAIRADANPYALCNCDSNSYTNRNTHVYAQSNTYTTDTSDPEASANSAAAPVEDMLA